MLALYNSPWAFFTLTFYDAVRGLHNQDPLTHWGREKWTPFRRRHFQMHFLEWKCINFYYNFTQVCSQWSNEQYSSTGSDNGFAPSRRQAIIWTNDVGLLTHICLTRPQWVNTLRPRQNGRHFEDETFKHIFWNEYVWIATQFSLKYVPKGPINNIATLFQIMTWRWLGDKPLPEPTMANLLTHICVTRP